jgi:2-aminoethylphosphonate transport system ATP-binding protein
LAHGDRQLTLSPRDIGTAPSEPAGIGFEGVSVAYKGSLAVCDFSLAIRPGEIMALIGPSGCGKTTVLRATAGFVRPTVGRIHIGGADVTALPPYARNIGMVVQNYALFPHMRVADNVAFGLRARGADPGLIRGRVEECLRLVGMADYAARFPHQLSGGQQQRIAIARALAIRPQVLLLDEPLSALDAQIRLSMLEELARLHASLPNLTVIYVTHDQTEALTLAGRIGIMRGGKLVALGSAQGLYRFPPNRFAAEFLGRANLLPVLPQPGAAEAGFARVRFGSVDLLARNEAGDAATKTLLCIRPHDLSWDAERVRANRLTGTVRAAHWKGDQHEVAVEIEGRLVRAIGAPMRAPPEPGSMLALSFAPDDATLIAEDHE